MIFPSLINRCGILAWYHIEENLNFNNEFLIKKEDYNLNNKPTDTKCVHLFHIYK